MKHSRNPIDFLDFTWTKHRFGINIQYGTYEGLIARHKLYTYSRTLARRYITIRVTHPLYF